MREKNKLGLTFLVQYCLLVCLVLPVNSWATASTFYTKHSVLHDPCGNPLIIRGVNVGNAFPSDPEAIKISEVAKTGANTVRLTFRWIYNYSDPDSVEAALSQALQNKMLTIPAVWDATGQWDKLPFAVDFWSQPTMVEILRRYEDIMLLNIANEAGDAVVSNEEYKEDYSRAIRQLRNAGLHMPLVIDAANWGRMESYILHNAEFLLKQDPDRNLLFSWHPWDIGQPKKRFQKGVDDAINANIPLIVGEFANTGPHHEGTLEYKHILEYSQKQSIGWLWWWWDSGKSVNSHSMTKDGIFGNWVNVGKEVALTSLYGIKHTSQKTHYLLHRECEVKQNAVSIPKPPSDLKVIATTGAEVRLDWKDNSDNENNFDIEVFDQPSNSWQLIKVVGSDTTSTTLGADLAFNYAMKPPRNKSLAYGTSYKFRVAAYQSRNAVSYSESVTVKTASNPGLCIEGEGLKADYYFAENGTHDFTQYNKPVMTRTDPEISFDWSQKSPDYRLAKDHFQVRWSGFVTPQFSGQYTFYINTDDLVQVWVDGKRIIDNWRKNGEGWFLGKIDLVQGKKHSILMLYRKLNDQANIELQWASSELAREVIPQCRLFAQ